MNAQEALAKLTAHRAPETKATAALRRLIKGNKTATKAVVNLVNKALFECGGPKAGKFE